MRLIGWCSPEGEFAQKPLLGKPCRSYVEAALLEAGAELVKERETRLFTHAEVALIVREDAPCLTAETLMELANAARGTLARPCVLLSQDLQSALAVALNKDALEAVVSGQTMLPTVERVVEVLNDLGVALRVWHDEHTDTYQMVCDAQSYAEVFRMLNQTNIAMHQQNGVIILDPERIVIEGGVTIGAGTMLYAGNTLQGGTVIGANCVLYPNNRIQNAAIGDETTVESSVLLDCSVGAHTTVGPYAYLRPHTSVGDHCRIGDFVEVKNSAIGDGTKVSHLTYVGDSDLGKDINLGCGVVFVNYDGKEKKRSRVEDHAFIGCNCNLVAPVHIGKNAYLAAGSTVVENVPEDALFVARARGVVKEEWVKRRKEAGKL
ncbi:MAG: hypothetical protein RR653_02165 [Clostridia bacterium]